MKEIDQKLDQWIYNSITRAEIRSLIVSAIHTHTKTVVETSDHYQDQVNKVHNLENKLATIERIARINASYR